MDAKDVVRECTALSDRSAIPFPEVVGRLIGAGVERYHADLIRADKIYYWPAGRSEHTPCDPVGQAPSPAFSAQGVESAVRAIQGGTISYAEFCKRIAAAGCVGYHVHIAGKRVIYYGRAGDSHTEWFPGAKPNSL